MSIDKLGQLPDTSKVLKSLTWKTKGRSLSAEIASILSDNASSKRATLSGAAIVFASACLLAPNYSFAKGNTKHKVKSQDSSELAAEVERLKRELGATKQENAQLRQTISSGNTSTPVDGANTAEQPAQEAVAAPVAETKEEVAALEPKNLSEVTVTSRRKEEKLQEVPIPISVIGGEQMKRDNIVSMQDFARRVPNLGVTTPNVRQTSIALRGLGKNSGNESMEASVGVMVDNVWSSWVGSTWTNYVDIDHVEVMRGPQGTLQGKNSNLGLVNVNTKAPSFKSAYYIDGFAGSRDSLQGKASATGSVIDGLLAYRASIFVDRRNGFIANYDSPVTVGKLQETNTLGGRIQFLLTPTEKLSARIILDRSSATQSMSVSPIIDDPSRFADGTLRTTTFSSRLGRDWFNSIRNSGQPLYVIGNPRAIAQNDKQVSRGDNQGASGEINWDIPGHKLTSITAYRYSLFEPHHDGDASTANIQGIGGLTIQSRQWTQELRLASDKPVFDGLLDYQFGLFALKSDATSFDQRTFGSDAGAFYASNAQYASLNATTAGQDVMRRSLDRVIKNGYLNPKVTSLAAYSQANIHITDKATLTLGIRDTQEWRTNAGYQTYKGGDDLSTLSAADRATALAIRNTAIAGVWTADRQGFSQNSQNWLVNPSYKFTKDIMAFFSVAGGQKSGAAQFNASTGAIENVNPENIMDYEVGLKAAWFDRKLTTNINLYNTDIKGFQSQLNVADASQPSGFRSTLGNVNGIQLRGVELDTAWQAAEGLSLFLNGSYNHAVYTDFKNAPCPPELNSSASCDQTGMQIPNAPKFTANYGVDYRVPLGFGKFNDYGLEWHTWLVDSFKSRANNNSSLSSSGVQAAYHVTDGGIGVGTKNGKYSLNLVGRNIFDTIYVTNVSAYSGTAGSSGTYGEGRYFGAQFRSNF
jgi:iron complex outermembrane receptor protein